MSTRDEAGPDTDVDDFDLVVIGSGPAGEKGATQAAYYGYRVAVVERRADPGGSAIAVSGVPVKALRDAAVYLTGWSRRDVFGIGLSLSPDLAMDRLRAHVTDVVTTMTQAVRANLERHGIQLVHGEASLGPERTVVVRGDDGKERILRTRVILIATGSRPHHPPDLPFDDPDVHDSETVLSIDRLPGRLVVVGGGPVGTEYASIFAALGVEVTLVDRGSRLLPILDAEISGALADSLRRSGARLMFESQVDSVTRTAEGLVVQVGQETLRADAVLHAWDARATSRALDWVRWGWSPMHGGASG